MSKSRNHTHKRFDDEYDYYFNDDDDRKNEQKLQERRKQKKIKNALRTKDIEILSSYDEME
jgi:hypothetical protein